MKKISLWFICFVLIVCNLILPVSSLEHQLYVDDQLLTYDVEELNNETHVYTYDGSHNEIAHVVIRDNVAYKLVNGQYNILAYIDESDPVNEKKQTRAAIPNWGGLKSQRRRISFPNNTSDALIEVTAVLIGVVFPGAPLAYGVAQSIATFIITHNHHFSDMTCYYREASGCPQYRWYDRYEYRTERGALIKTVSLNRKSFIGVRNSPQNPPACRSYGF